MSDLKVLNFMGYRKTLAVASLVLILVSLGSLAVRGLNFGLDFTGGAQIEVGYEEREVNKKDKKGGKQIRRKKKVGNKVKEERKK